MNYVVDTNALLLNCDVVDDLPQVIVPYAVLQELDRIKMEASERGWQARSAVRKLKASTNISYDLLDDTEFTKNDDKIVACAVRNQAALVTGDNVVLLKAQAQGLEVVDVLDAVDEKPAYSGLVEIDTLDLDDDGLESLALIHTDPTENPFNLLPNQYLIVYTGDKHSGSYKWDGVEMKQVAYKMLKSEYLGTVKPRNPHQQLTFDLLQDRETTVKALFGRFGTGKDYLMIANALSLIEKGVFDRIVWVRNNVEVKDSEKIGFLPSDMNSKLLPFAMPLADHVGGVEALQRLMGVTDDDANEKQMPVIEIQHLGFIRGRDIKRSIIYVTECENNTAAHIQLLLGRVGEGSEIWFNGDLKQVDHDKFKHNNGVNTLQRLAGHKRYGQVTLYKTERSETAAMADLLD